MAVATADVANDASADAKPPKTPEESLVHLSRSCRKNLKHLVRHTDQDKSFRAAAQQPYARLVDSNGDTKMLFCDTGNNAASVMALARFRVQTQSFSVHNSCMVPNGGVSSRHWKRNKPNINGRCGRPNSIRARHAPTSYDLDAAPRTATRELLTLCWVPRL